MITHIPEGLVPFAPCGYQRTPRTPLVGQMVAVRCRVDEGGGKPTLRWSVNGEPKREIEGEPCEGGCFSFELGAFDHACRVHYAFCIEGEAMRAYVFDVCTVEEIGAPSELLTNGDAVLAVFESDFAVELRAEDGFVIRYLRTFHMDGQSVEHAKLHNGDFLINVKKSCFFWELKRLSYSLAQASRLSLVRDSKRRIVSVTTAFSHDGQHLFGLGERFDVVDQMDCRREIKVVEKFTQQAEHSYLPVPFLFNEQGIGWFRSGGMPIMANLSGTIELEQPVEGDNVLIEDHLMLGAPKDQMAALMRLTGKPAMPPEWAFGVWMSANGWNSGAEVDAQLDAIKRYDYPASALVLEAWSDEQTFYTWNDAEHWKDAAATVQKIREANLHLLLWQIPVIKYQENPNAALQADEREAIERGYVVRSGDGSPYRIPDLWFKGSLLPDFTNPDARRWWFQKREHLIKMGVEGFKTDGGEFLYDQSAQIFDGTRGTAARNLFANQYISAYHEFMREQGVPPLTFSRAGYSGAQAFPMHWSGDQLSQWSELRAQLVAGLSAGLSGILFWGFDIGGFAGELPTKELYLRATAMACFCPVMQWHAEPRSGQFYATHESGFVNDRSPWNLAEKLKDPELLDIARAFAKLRYELMPYILDEAKFCVEQSRPLMAHLAFDFPDDPNAWTTHDEYMFGRSMLVAPITEEGAMGRNVYLPEGTWRDYFQGTQYTGQQTISVECPLARLPVYLKE